MIFQFAEFSIDTDRRELKRGDELIATEPQVFDLLVYLIQHRDRVVSKDDLIEGVWGGRIVSESTLASRINAVRRALGDSGAEQRLIRTVARKGLRFVGELRGSAGGEAPATPRLPSADLRQDVQFCTAWDGVRIAYASVGEGLPLVKCANWLNHLEYDWQSPVWSPLLKALAGRYRLIRYDERGNGLSDWEVDDISLEAFVRDLECIADTNGLDKFALLGISQGCAVSHRLCRAPSRACQPSRALWRLRARQAPARPEEGGRAGRCPRDTDAPRLGSGEPGVPPDLHVPVHSGRHGRAGAVVQRPAAHDHVARECRPHSPCRRHHRRQRTSRQSEGADAGPALPRRRGAALRRRPPDRRRHPRGALRRRSRVAITSSSSTSRPGPACSTRSGASWGLEAVAALSRIAGVSAACRAPA